MQNKRATGLDLPLQNAGSLVQFAFAIEMPTSLISFRFIFSAKSLQIDASSSHSWHLKQKKSFIVSIQNRPLEYVVQVINCWIIHLYPES